MAMKSNSMQTEKEEIIRVGRLLHDKGLLVRTWGNISSRIDEKHFLITPSGIRYEDLTPEMIVCVNAEDLSYEGSILPSSEKMVHAVCYQRRKDARFIVHTHQVYASCAGALGLHEISTEYEEDEICIPCAPYALPGTQKLADHVSETLQRYKQARGLIMSNHGTVCIGSNSAEAVQEAVKLEIAANNFLMDRCNTDIRHGVCEGYSSRKTNGQIIYDIEDTPDRVKRIHEEIYTKRPDISHIVHNKSEAVMLMSRRAVHMKPLLDDFAQLIGTEVTVPLNVHGHDGDRLHIRKNVNVVFNLNDGAYCLGKSRDDAEAVAIVLDKGCIAQIAATRYGEAHFLSWMDCMKMNRHYRKKYSKLAEQHE
jgi:L-fuculose-phosphate aldolase